MNILVVEDEADILKSLVISLEGEGWSVRATSSLSSLEAVLQAKSFYPHVIILDRMLSGEDSVQILDRIKERFADTKILILSAIDTGTEKARVLDLGADDYLAKPYSSSELIARIKALHRRSTLVHSTSKVQVGNLTLNQLDRSLFVEGDVVSLSQKEFQLLLLFANNPGKIFPKDLLIEQVWKTSKESDSKVVEATMNNLRRKLESSAASVQIRNVRNVGYWLEA
ncbi:Transcriptional regulatory protein BasR [compost metagenome]